MSRPFLVPGAPWGNWEPVNPASPLRRIPVPPLAALERGQTQTHPRMC